MQRHDDDARKTSRAALLPALVALVVGPLGACTPDFDDVWEIKDLRVLGIRADPPEVLLPATALLALDSLTFPPVRVDALVVDPREPDASVSWQVIACTPEEQDGCQYAARSDRVWPAPDSDQQWQRSRLDEIGFDFVLDPQLAIAALEADPFKGFGGLPILIELRVRGAEEVSAFKRLVYGVFDPPNKLPNANPSLAQVKVDDEPIPDSWVLDPEEKVVLLPEAADGSKEDYVVRTFSGGTEDLEEFISFSFFVTSGELSHARTGGRPSAFVTAKKVEDVTSELTAPADGSGGTLWVLVRDDRGGIDWTSFEFELQ